MREHEPVEKMKDYIEEWSPAQASTMTSGGILISMSNHEQATVLHRIPEKYGWVVDQIHWESKMFHIIPATEVGDV